MGEKKADKVISSKETDNEYRILSNPTNAGTHIVEVPGVKQYAISLRPSRRGRSNNRFPCALRAGARHWTIKY